MNNQLCFIIEKQNLYLVEVLVWFNDIPLLFVCRNEDNQRFLVLCTELERFEYLIAETSAVNLVNMLTCKSTMRDTILKGKKFWKVASGDTIENDLCEEIEMDDIDISLLPEEGTFFDYISKRNIMGGAKI